MDKNCGEFECGEFDKFVELMEPGAWREEAGGPRLVSLAHC